MREDPIVERYGELGVVGEGTHLLQDIWLETVCRAAETALWRTMWFVKGASFVPRRIKLEAWRS
jgi:hypothetical protein